MAVAAAARARGGRAAAAAATARRPRRPRRAAARAAAPPAAAEPAPPGGGLAAAAGATKAFVSNVLPYYTLIIAGAALAHPPAFAWIGKEWWSVALTAIMVSVGINLEFKDFTTMPWKTVSLGLLISIAVRPLVAAAVVAVFSPPAAIAAGIYMLACVPVSTLCNFGTVVCSGNVPVSVMLVALSTILSVATTPLLAEALVGVSVQLDTMGMIKTIIDVVLLPVLFGLLMNQYLPAVASLLKVVLPFLGLAGATVCSGAPVAAHAAAMKSSMGLAVLPAVLALHLGTLGGGFAASRVAGFATAETRTVALGCSMLSSLLAVLLVSKHLPDPASVVPCAISIILMCSVGLITAAVWSALDKRK